MADGAKHEPCLAMLALNASAQSQQRLHFRPKCYIDIKPFLHTTNMWEYKPTLILLKDQVHHPPITHKQISMDLRR